MTRLTADQWETFQSRFEDVHILQSGTWGEFKEKFGWQAVFLVAGETGAQVLIRKAPLGLRIAYIPRGPVGDNWKGLWETIHDYCRAYKITFLKVEPDCWESNLTGDLTISTGLLPTGFRRNSYNIQPRSTLLIDITQPVERLLKNMKQKTRYNINLARRKGVVISESADISKFYGMMLTTGNRDGFGIHSLTYYQQVFSAFREKDSCRLFFAEFQGEVIAGIMVFANRKRAWYFYGASSENHRELMPNYLLQWEAMLWAKRRGCETYDLWGIPDEPLDTLEAQYLSRYDQLWGVYRFKRGFGGEIKRTIGSWEWVYSPLVYRFYQVYLARIGKVSRD